MEVLEGPNEEKALTAMRLMLGSDDPTMERMALRAGLTSTSGVARGFALKTFLNTQPSLMAFATAATEGEVNVGFEQWLEANGSLSSATTGSFPIAVGAYLSDENCFGSSSGSGGCFGRLGGTEFSFRIGSAWGTARLNDSGASIGAISHRFDASRSTGPMSLTIPLQGQLQ